MENFEIESSIYKHTRTIIHFDIDCFYAQCEMIKNPELYSKPVGIKQKNYIITSNYVAREYGLKKCMLMTDALSLCPQLVVINGEDLYEYRKMSSCVTDIIKEFTNKVEKLGLDENYADVSDLVSSRLEVGGNNALRFEGHVYKDIADDECSCGCYKRLMMGSKISKEIRDRIRETLGLTCSAGIGHNKLVAKLVGSEHKPDQQTIILPIATFALLSDLNIKKIPGIGRKTVDMLNSLNLKSVVDIQNCSLSTLEKNLGKNIAIKIFQSCFGVDDSDVKISGKPQTLSVEDAVGKITSVNEVQDKFSDLIKRLLILIGEDGRIPNTIKVTLRIAYRRESRQCNISPKILKSENANLQILEIVMQIFRTIVSNTKQFQISLVGVGFTNFKEVYSGHKSIVSFLEKSAEGNDSNLEMLEDKKNVNFVVNDKVVSTIHVSNITDLDGPFDEKQLACSSLADTNIRPINKIYKCPKGIDEEVFYQLPPDIQQEIMNNQITLNGSKVNINESESKSNKTKKRKLSHGQTNKIDRYFSK